MISLQTAQASPFDGIEIGSAVSPPEWFPGFIKSLSRDDCGSPGIDMGRLLCSAIVHGALLDPKLWNAWCNGLSNFNRWSSIDWVEFYVPDEWSPKGYSTKRWFADPITGVLISKWNNSAASLRQRKRYDAHECLDLFIQSISPNSSPLNQASTALLSWATLFWRLRTPSLLIDQALGVLPTVSLSPYQFARLLGGKHELSLKGSEAVSRPDAATHSRQLPYQAVRSWMKSFKDSFPAEQEAFENAKKMWRNGALGQRQAKAQCIANLEIVLKKNSGEATVRDEYDDEARRILLKWCQARLEANRRPYKRGFAPYTVQQRLVVLIGGVFQGRYPHSEAELEQVSLLRRASEAATNEHCLTRRRLIHEAVKDFLRYARSEEPEEVDPEEEGRDANLEYKANEAQAIVEEFAELVGQRGPTSVSANLISTSNYGDSVDRAYEECPNGELSLIIMLGFRAGLRLREILGLRTSDFVTGEWRLEIHLDHNHFRDGKTFHSRRILPLDLLLTPNERKAMKNWLAPRKKRASEAGKSLLCFGAVDATSMADEYVYERQINRILTSASDRYVNFSHLRHSFGSFLLLNLLLPSEESELFVPRSIRPNVTWKRKMRLQSALLGRDRLGRSALHAVSQMMGHTGVLRTLESYQHLLDLALGIYVNRQAVAPCLPPDAIKALELNVKGCARKARSAGTRRFLLDRVTRNLEPMAPLTDGSQPISMSPKSRETPSDWFASRIKYSSSPRRNVGVQSIRSDSAAAKVGWRLLIDLMNASVNEAKAKAVEHGICSADLMRWRKRYRQVIKSAFAPGALPDGLTRPRGHQADQVAEGVWSKLPAQLDQDEILLVQKFLNNFRPARYHGVFDNLVDAEAFASFLRKIGFSPDHIFIASGPADKIREYKTKLLMEKESRNGKTLYHRPANLREMSSPNRSGKSRNPVVLWFRYIKFERDALGLRFDRRYRLDAYQERKDKQLLERGQKLPDYREKAAANRKQRAAEDELRNNKSTVFSVGNKAYYFSLILAAVYYDIELKVQFPKTPHSGNMKSRERRLTNERVRRSAKLGVG